MDTTLTSSMVLRKRSRGQREGLVLHLSSPPPNCDLYSGSEYEPEVIPRSPVASTSSGKRAKTPSANGGYICSFEGCNKVYTKPSRLAEHQRSHTGERPYVCTVCSKTYLRESHLQAHARSHQPASSKPFVCEVPECGKRFWTTQHLRVHSELHQGEKPFKCAEPGCNSAYSKHHQLREHICVVHSPPGTKPYQCEHTGCTKSFATNQKLRAHLKTHDDKRYTCVHQDCIVTQSNTPTYYPTWTALQHHMRTAHPPRCPHPSCNGKTFSAQRNLKAHLKIHEHRDQEEAIYAQEASENEFERPHKKRRGGEFGRDWVCEVEGCDKDFKSKKALTNHVNVNHLGSRNFVCPHEDCARAFGYKHLLQRHLAKLHAEDTNDNDRDGSEDDEQDEAAGIFITSHIDDITGVTFATRTHEKTQTGKSLCCPYPILDMFGETSAPSLAGSSTLCNYTFSRAYDLRRHLKSAHDIDLDKEEVDEWVRSMKNSPSSSSVPS